MSKVVRIRLALIITGLTTGGAEAMLLKLLQKIDLSRFTPTVISLTTMGEIGPHIEAFGIRVHALGITPGALSTIKFLRLVRLLLQFKPDVVHTWMYHADLLGGLAARLAGVRAISWGIRHTDLSASANKRSTLAVMRACARLSRWLPQKILVNSTVAAKAHASQGYSSDKMVVIPNGFDLGKFSPTPLARIEVREELGLASTTFLVGVIGRFHPQKNQIGFIEAIAVMHRIEPDVHFLLVGQGIDMGNAQLKATMQSAGVTAVCHLLGARTDVSHLMAGLDVLALPSVGEAFPNVVGEAMACAVPCAVTDVGDSAWIVGETGRVVPVGDMSGLAHAIYDLLKLPADERAVLGATARERVANLFEIGTVVKQYEAFYESLISNGT
ncbi:RfaG Glycosyltransferase [Oxalobacteraceae bacterium]|jgi:glycosyltransferase involved in cell wall biosynthesis